MQLPLGITDWISNRFLHSKRAYGGGPASLSCAIREKCFGRHVHASEARGLFLSGAVNKCWELESDPDSGCQISFSQQNNMAVKRIYLWSVSNQFVAIYARGWQWYDSYKFAQLSAKIFLTIICRINHCKNLSSCACRYSSRKRIIQLLWSLGAHGYRRKKRAFVERLLPVFHVCGVQCRWWRCGYENERGRSTLRSISETVCVARRACRGDWCYRKMFVLAVGANDWTRCCRQTISTCGLVSRRRKSRFVGDTK